MVFTWRREEVFIGLEDKRGEIAKGFIRIPKTEVDFENKVEKVEDISALGTILDSSGSYITKSWADGNLWMNIGSESFGYFMKAVLGDVNSSDVDINKKHEFTIQNSNIHPTISVVQKNPVGVNVFTNAVIDSLTISGEQGAFVTMTSTLKSKSSEKGINDIKGENDDIKFLSQHVSLRLADDIESIKTAPKLDVKSFELTFEKNTIEDYVLGETSPKDFFNQNLRIHGSVSAVFKNDEFKKLGLSDTKKSLYLVLEDTKNSKSIEFELPLVDFQNWALTKGNDEIATQDIEFVNRSKEFKCTLMNSTLSY